MFRLSKCIVALLQKPTPFTSLLQMQTSCTRQTALLCNTLESTNILFNFQTLVPTVAHVGPGAGTLQHSRRSVSRADRLLISVLNLGPINHNLELSERTTGKQWHIKQCNIFMPLRLCRPVFTWAQHMTLQQIPAYGIAVARQQAR